MSIRKGVSLIETLVVLAIIAVLLGLLLPALNAARQLAIELVCKNNLKQINLAVAGVVETQKRLPAPGISGVVGGWTIEMLPYLDQKNLRDRITTGGPISAAPDFLLRQPRLLTCPNRDVVDPPNPTEMDHAHYILVTGTGRKSFGLCDAPLDVKVPWASGPEMRFDDVVRRIGPHNRGFFFAGGFQDGVNFVPSNQANP